MRKVIIFFIFSSFFMVSCYEEKAPTEQPFFVHLYTQFCSQCKQETINGLAYAYLFKDEGKEVNKEESFNSVQKSGLIKYTDGSEASYIYKSTPVYDNYKFEKIPNGDYILLVTYSTDYYTTAGAAHKRITVNADYQFTIERKVFLFKKLNDSDEYGYGYQEWDEKW